MPEIWTQLVQEDFEIGDRVYRYNSNTKETVFGTIITIYPNVFVIKIDLSASSNAGEKVYISLNAFQRDAQGKSIFVTYWAKALDLLMLDVPGSILSFVDSESKERKYARVNFFEPDTCIELTFLDKDGKFDNVQYLWAEKHKSLENKLRDFVLEG